MMKLSKGVRSRLSGEYLKIAMFALNSGNPLAASSKTSDIRCRALCDWVIREGSLLKKFV
jgi:hypothetical protein